IILPDYIAAYCRLRSGVSDCHSYLSSGKRIMLCQIADINIPSQRRFIRHVHTPKPEPLFGAGLPEPYLVMETPGKGGVEMIRKVCGGNKYPFKFLHLFKEDVLHLLVHGIHRPQDVHTLLQKLIGFVQKEYRS